MDIQVIYVVAYDLIGFHLI